MGAQAAALALWWRAAPVPSYLAASAASESWLNCSTSREEGGREAAAGAAAEPPRVPPDRAGEAAAEVPPTEEPGPAPTKGAGAGAGAALNRAAGGAGMLAEPLRCLALMVIRLTAA